MIRKTEPNTHQVVVCLFFLFAAWSTLKSSKYLESLQLTQKNTRLFGSSGDGSSGASKDIVQQSWQREGGVDWQVTSTFYYAYLKS